MRNKKGQFEKGLIPWNKNKKGVLKPNSGSFKKGNIPWDKGLKGIIVSPMEGNHHTKKAKDKIRKSLLGKTGELARNWQGNRMANYSENERIRKSNEYVLWRKSIFERDNFICQKYGTIGGKLIAHHINNFSDFPELRLAIDNGITLSKKAHDEFHKKYDKKNNTREQLKEFLCQK